MKKDLAKNHDKLQYFGQKRLKTLLKIKNALVRAPKGRKIWLRALTIYNILATSG
jgi:hypothetical protein